MRAQTVADPFRAYHRGSRRRTIRRASGIGVSVAIVAALGVWLVPQMAPATTSMGADASGSMQAAMTAPVVPPVAPDQPQAAPPGSVSPENASPDVSPESDPPGDPSPGESRPGSTLPVEEQPVASPGPPAPSADPVPPASGPQTFDIAIDTRGFQAEIDRCLWVRMDIGAAAPIIGRHNHCGGDIVLAMRPGDVVRLSGTDLDGLYMVSGSRDAEAGDNAADATDGILASAILQTCYTGSTTVRLVALIPIAE